MKELGLKSIREGSKAMYQKEKRQCKNYVNQQFMATRPNEIWISDVTQIRINDETYFICIILDLYARRVVGYKIGPKNSTQLIKSCFKSAWETRSPGDGLILHTVRGGNYRAKAFTDYMFKLNVTHSYSRPHVPYDNSVAESFFASLKREELYKTKYRSEREFRTAVKDYIEIYNMIRPHSSNRYKTPLEKEQEYYEKNTL